ncbi:MAG: ABC transporter ATP-binding protein/permease [Bacilli bacterium]|nr:ABC transporter ATP-binding protein/permease [Bacilli bacterium]
MIKINKLNKYFNKGKKNEIHVINDTTLELSDTGLVALLGPSGCGKTTLLNAIGGLDNVNSGDIYINDKKMTRFLSSKKDELRTLNIGYIFQDYHLIEELSVYDNVAIVLKMIGIKDKIEIKKRVDYVLERVGLYKYRKRNVGMLSGGERQRVGIARAIVKNPDIIIADEPTGNLDSKNTIEVMNIIKSISKNKLVILVTHEKDIANFYASRIIEILDGKVVKDKENIHNNDLDYRIENKIYLKDIKNHETIKSNNLSIDYYSEDNKKLNVKIVVKNGNIYIESDSKNKLEVIDNDSTLELVNDTYKKINKETYEKYNFDFNEIINNNIKLKYSSIFNPITLLISGFKKIKSYPILKKILLVGFFISSMFVLYSVSNIAGILNVEDKDFVTHNKSYLSINLNKINKDNYLEYEKNEDINYILPGNSSVIFSIKYDFYLQTIDAIDTINASLSSLNMISNKDLVYGRMPENDHELVIDKMALESTIKRKLAQQVGITDSKDYLDLNIQIDNMDKFKIVGITDLQSPSIYTFEDMFINILSNSKVGTNTDYGFIEDYSYQSDNKLLDYKLVSDLKIKQGRLPEKDYEVIVNYDERYSYPLNKQIDKKVNDKKLKVVGYYTNDINNMLVSNNTIKYKLLDDNKEIIVYPKDKDRVTNYFKEKSIKVQDIYDKDKKDYMEERKEYVKSSSLVAIIMLSISLVEIYLMIRSSFLSRIKEVGILRAIGIKKMDIYKMFLGEILAITLTASTLGLIVMGYVIKELTELPLLGESYLFNLPIILISVLIVYGFNIIVGLLPVFNTIRKTPAQILSRIDAD